MSETDAAIEPAEGLVSLEDVKPTAKNGAKKKPAKRRASITTRMIANLQFESQSKSSWIVGCLFFKESIPFEKIRDVVASRLLTIPRFRSKMVKKRFPTPRLLFHELDDDEIDLDYHVRQVFEDRAVSDDEFKQYLGCLFDDFNHDLDRPMWQMTFIPKLADGRSVLISNVSHILADGSAAVEMLLRMLDKPEDPEEALQKSQSVRPQNAKRKPVPLGPFTKMRVFVGGVFDGLFAAFTSPDRYNSLRLKDMNKPSPTKRCCFSPSLDLQRVKDVKNKLEGATINDVLMSVITMTLQEYFKEAGETFKRGQTVRAQFPINLRKRNEPGFKTYKDGVEDSHNNFAYSFMTFLVHYDTAKHGAIGLVWETKRTIDKIKQSPSPLVQKKVGKVVGNILPKKELNKTLINLAAKATVQVSNVAGPAEEAHIGGCAIDALQFMLSSPLPTYIGLLTYNGKLSMSVNLDSQLCDPELIAQHFVPCFEKLESEVMALEGPIPQPRGCCDCL